ncbi:hypothetical protein WDA79_09610, partial [Streptomyces sp. A475]|uniref:hypothetical protein n=1 Tax=Streptomyces sp. A475 TaxID=3131976 RepID=UPI0030C9F777
RRRRALLALAGVSLGVQLTVLAANPAPCFRYMAAPMFIGVLCLALIPALRAEPAERPRTKSRGAVMRPAVPSE